MGEKGFDIGEAVARLRVGRFVFRGGWNGKGMFLGLQTPDLGSVNTLPYVYIVTAEGQRVPWLCSQTDLLADDWFEVQEKVGTPTGGGVWADVPSAQVPA